MIFLVIVGLIGLLILNIFLSREALVTRKVKAKKKFEIKALNKYLPAIKAVFKKAGMEAMFDKLNFSILFIAYLIVLFILFLSGRDLVSIVVIGVGILLCPWLYIKGKTKERTRRFQKTSYKIYKYLNSQVKSGVGPLAAMRGVFLAVDDEKISYELAAFVARYEMTQSMETAAEDLKEAFDANEVETLLIAFDQGIKTGDNSEIVELQEEIMFDNYMNILQLESKKSQAIAIAAAIMYGIVGMSIISVPMIVELFGGFQNFFG